MSERYAITRGTDYEAVILKNPNDTFTQEEIERFKREYEAKGYVYWGKDVFLGGLEGLVFKIPKSSQQETKTKTEVSIPQEVQTRPDIVYLTKQKQEVEQQIQKVEQIERRMEIFEDIKQRAQELISAYEQGLEKYKDIKSEEDIAKLAGYFSKLGSDIRLFIDRELRVDYPEIIALRNRLSEISIQSMNISYSLLQQRDKILSGKYEIDREKAQEFVQSVRSSLFQISQDISSIKLNITKEEIARAKSQLYEAKSLIESELQQRAQITFQPGKEEYMKAFQLMKEIEEWKSILKELERKKQLTPEIELEIWKEIKKKEGELAELYLFYPEMQKVIPEMENYFKNPFAQIGYNIQAILGKHFWEYPIKFFTEKSEGVGKLFEEALVETIVGRALKPPTTKEGFLESHKEFWLEGAGSVGTGYVIGAGIGAAAGTAVSKGPSLFSKVGEILKPVSSKVGSFIEPITTNIKFYGSKVVHGAEKIAEKIGAVIPQQVKDFFGKTGEVIGKGFVRAVKSPTVVFAGTEGTIRGYEAFTELSAGKNPKEVGEKIASEVLRDAATFYTGIKGFEEAYQHFGSKKIDTYLIAKSEGMSDKEMAEYLKSLKKPNELVEKMKSVEEYKVYEIEGKDSLARITKFSKEKPIFFKDIVEKGEIPVLEILKKGKVVKEEYPFKLIEYKGGLYLFSSLPPKKVIEGDLVNVLKIGKEYEKGISLELLTPESKDVGLFRVSARKSLSLPIAEEEEKVGLRILPKSKPSERDVLKDLAEYYKKQFEKEAEEKAREEALKRAKELEKSHSEKSQAITIGEVIEESTPESEEKKLEREIRKVVGNLAGVEYSYVVKPPKINPVIPFSQFNFSIESIRESLRRSISFSQLHSTTPTSLNFISKVESSLSNMLERMQRVEKLKTQELKPFEMTRQIQLDFQDRSNRLLTGQILTPNRRTEKITPPEIYTTTKTPTIPPLIPFRPIRIRITRSPPRIPIFKPELPFSSKSKSSFKSFEKFFGFPKSKYEPSLLGLMFGVKTKNISKLLTGFEIRGIPIKTRRR
jgi:hypothetical protein